MKRQDIDKIRGPEVLWATPVMCSFYRAAASGFGGRDLGSGLFFGI